MIQLKPINKEVLKNAVPKTHKNISNTIIEMISVGLTPFYAEFCLSLNFIEANIQTAGVNVTSKGMNFYWDRNFFDNLKNEEIIFILIHEVLHLLLNHPSRTNGFDLKISNVAQDMIINSIIHGDIILDKNIEKILIPKDEFGNNTALFVPKEYNGKLIFEELYMWLLDEYEKRKGNIKGKDEYGKNGKSLTGTKKNSVDMYSLDTIFKNMESNNGQTLDHHIKDTIPIELKNSIIDNVVERLKNRGLLSNDIVETINKLRKKRKDYLKILKATISNHLFGNIKKRTITKPNRRGIQGLKGKKKLKKELVVIVDTSQSMTGEFEKVLNFIFRNDITFQLIQIDAKIQMVVEITNMKQLEKMKIVGHGGTTLTPAIKHITEDKYLSKLNLLILTDGYTDTLNFSGYKGKVLILSTSKKCPHVNDKSVKQIIITKEYE